MLLEMFDYGLGILHVYQLSFSNLCYCTYMRMLLSTYLSILPNTSTNFYSLAHSCFNSYTPELVPIFYYRDKTWVHMFYFLINQRYFNRPKVSIQLSQSDNTDIQYYAN